MKWFAQVYRMRLLCSCALLCLLSGPVLLTYQTVSIISPLSTASAALATVLSLHTVFLSSAFITTLIVIMLIYSATTTAQVPVYRTRVAVFWSAASPAHLPIVLLFGLMGGSAGYILSLLCGSSGESIVLTLHGVFTGTSYGWSYFTRKEMVLVLPPIQQSVLFSLRGHTWSHVRGGLVKTLKGLRWFYPVYYFSRGIIESRMGWWFDYETSSAVSMLSVGLFLQLVLTGTIIHTLWKFGLTVLRIMQRQLLKFPVLAMFSSESNKLLTDALQSKSPIVRHMAFYDLCQLAWQASPRRSQVYSLDRAGRPVVWESICKECLSVINQLTSKLIGDTQLPGVTATSTTGVQPTLVSPPMVSRKGWSTPEPPVLNRRRVGETQAQLWSYSSPTKPLVPPPVNPGNPLDLTRVKMKSVQGFLKALSSLVAQKLKKKPFFIHFLSPLPGTDEQLLYADCHLIVCAITGLSELVVASYSEDQYGVVQKSLNQVLTSLISLSQAFDKHLKTPLSSSPSTSDLLAAQQMNGKYAIKNSVLTSLQRLENTFSREKRAFQISHQHLDYWSSKVKH